MGSFTCLINRHQRSLTHLFDRLGVDSVGDELLNGTAFKYADKDSYDFDLASALPFLYVYKFSRNCPVNEEGQGCLTIPSQAVTGNYVPFIPISDPIGFAERM